MTQSSACRSRPSLSPEMFGKLPLWSAGAVLALVLGTATSTFAQGTAPKPEPTDQPIPSANCAGCGGATGVPPGCVCRYPSTGECFLEIGEPYQVSPGRLVLEASAIVCCSNCRGDICNDSPCPPPSDGAPPEPTRCPVHFSVTLSVTWDINVTVGGQIVVVQLQGAGGFSYQNSVTVDAGCEISAEVCHWVKGQSRVEVRRGVTWAVNTRIVKRGRLFSNGFDPCPQAFQSCEAVCSEDTSSVTFDRLVSMWCGVVDSGSCASADDVPDDCG